MAAEEEIMKIRLDADLSGGVATEKQYDRLIAKAKEIGKASCRERVLPTV